MRFAGSRIEGFFGDDSPNFGQMAQKSHAIRNKEKTTVTDLMGQTAATGIKAAGDVEAAKIDGQARSALASAQGQASMMESIGGIGSSLIGSFGGGISSYSQIPDSGLRGAAAGGGTDAYFGTGGKYGNFQPPTQNASGMWSF